MATVDDLISLLPTPVWSRSSGTTVYSLFLAFANEFDRFNDLANFVHQQVNITTSEGEFLDIHGLDFGVSRTINQFTNQSESDAAFRQSILSTFDNIRLNKYVLENLLAPLSNNTPVVLEDMIDSWFVGGNPAVDLTPFSFIGYDTIGESINLIGTKILDAYSATSLTFSVENTAPDEYVQLSYPINAVSSSQFSISDPAINLQGAFKDGRNLAFYVVRIINNLADTNPVGISSITYASVVSSNYADGENIVTVFPASVPSLILSNPTEYAAFVAPLHETVVVSYQEPISQYLYQWTAEVQPDGTVEIDESKRADVVPPSLIGAGILPLGPDGSISNYSLIPFDLLSVRGQLDPMYRIDIILSITAPKCGDAGFSGEGLDVGITQFPSPSKISNVLLYNKLGGVEAKTFFVEQYAGDFLNNSNQLSDLYG